MLITSDLGCTSSVTGAAARTGAPLRTALGASSIDEKLAEATPALVIVDLSMPGLKPAELIPSLRARLPEQARILAFGSHVHTALLAAAREAGCDVVISRGEFHAHMDDYLRRDHEAPPDGETRS
ncbi:MAG: hypothetical protein ACREHD_01890 [Pirellulales bacterium]